MPNPAPPGALPRGLAASLSAANLAQIVIALAVAAIVQLHLRRYKRDRGEGAGAFLSPNPLRPHVLSFLHLSPFLSVSFTPLGESGYGVVRGSCLMGRR